MCGISDQISIDQVSLCNTEEIECASEVSIDEDSCLPKCSGLQISSYDKESIEKNKDLLQNMDSILKMQLNALATAYKGLTGYSLPSSLTSWSK